MIKIRIFFKKIYLIFFHLVLYQLNGIQSICPLNESVCNCHINPSGNYEIQCVQNDRHKLLITVEPDKYVSIECNPNTNFDDYKLLPKLHLENVEQVILRMCPMNENITFRYIIDNLKINQTNTLRYQTFEINSPAVLERRHFHGLENLVRLEITHNKNATYFSSDAFKDLKNLEHLNLYDNNIELMSDMFINNKKLHFLELGQNNIEQIPDGTFNSLINLINLNLWGNQITTLNETIFGFLSNLQTLDIHRNKIQKIPENIFTNLTKLQSIYLQQNDFMELPKNLFKNNLNLETVILTDNMAPTLNVSEKFLSNLPNLKTVEMERNNINHISENTFWNSPNITDILLNDNLLMILAANTFRDCQNLIFLDLSSNYLYNISDNLFKNLRKLEVLLLDNNHLTTVTSNIFSNLINLRKLDLSNNQIVSVQNKAFSRTTHLEEIYLANNKIVFTGQLQSPFGNLKMLSTLILTNNSINRIENDWRLGIPSLNLLNLTYNEFQYVSFDGSFHFISQNLTVDLRHNKIEMVDMRFAEPIARLQEDTDAYSGRKNNIVILLDDNPIKCTCQVYNLLRYLNGKMDERVRAMVEIVPGNLTCTIPTLYRTIPVTKIDIREFICDYSHQCPDNCTCIIRPYDKSLIVNCSHQLLKTPPLRLPMGKSHKILLYLNNNNLTKFDVGKLVEKGNSGYGNITELYIHNNNISEIKWLPPNVQVVELHSNNFKQINVTLLKKLLYLRRLTLFDNPWQCDCDSLDLLSYIQDEYMKIANIANVRCGNMSIAQMTSNEFCPFPLEAIISLTTFFIMFTIFVTVLVVLFYRNEQAIKVWLYAHNKCLWFVTEEELDKDKKYDAFVSYAHQDEDFVVNELIPNLEHCNKPFKLCIHNRDWLAGEWITDQIARSIEDSRRTLVILSPHFLNSVWGKMELRSAHMNSLREGRARVIIIKKGEIDSYDKLDPELRAYLQTNTYIEWGDKNFWEKLRYALPHPPPLSRRAALISERIKQSLSDKIELVPPILTPATTPIEPVDKNPLVLRINLENSNKQPAI